MSKLYSSKFLNTVHINIKFTIEHENEKKLAFLDTCVKREGQRYYTTRYHKKTFTEVYLNWTSLTARRYKIGFIRCLLIRIYAICSEQKDKDLEVEKLKHLLIQNEYPKEVVNKEEEKFLSKQKSKSQTTDVVDLRDETRIVEPDMKKTKFIVLPYTHRKCEDFGNRLKRLVNENFPQVDFKVAFQTQRTIGSLFPFKDNIKRTEDKSHVVYKLKCKDCEASYIGKTQRILSIRIDEHEKRTDSACYQHAEVLNHQIDYENITDSANSDMKLQIKELLHILRRKPSINKQLNAQSEFDIKTILVQAYAQFRHENTVSSGVATR
jgi:hypothetical protein